MLDLFKSSILGNTISIISLVIGLWSLWITYRTFKKTKFVESQIKETKVHTESKYLLNNYKKTAIPSLENKLKALQKAGYATNPFIMELSEVTRTILDFSSSLDSESVSCIQKAHTFIFNFKYYKDENQLRILNNHIVAIINVLKKGENISS